MGVDFVSETEEGLRPGPERTGGDPVGVRAGASRTRLRRVEEALQASERRYRALFEHAAEGLALQEVITDAAGRPCDGRFLDVNPAFERLTGLSRGDLVGRTLRDVLPEPDGAWAEAFARAAGSAEPVVYEHHDVQRDAWFEVRGYAPTPGQVVLAVSDITARKTAQESVDRERAQLSGIVDSIPMMLIIWEPELKRFILNTHARRVLGWSDAAAADGEFMSRLFPDPDERAEVSAFMRSLTPQWREWNVATGDGGVIPSEWCNVPFNADTMVGIGRDLRESKQAERALVESEARLRALVDNLPFEVWAMSAEGRYTFANPVCRSGWGPRVGKRPEEVAPSEEVLRQWLSNNERAFGGEVVTGEVTYRRRDGVRVFRNVVAPVHVGGAVQGIFGVNIDITGSKAAERALRESRARYRSLFESIDEGFCIIEVIFADDGRAVDYRYLETNPAFVRQTGLTQAEGRTMGELCPGHEDYWFEAFGQVALTGEPRRFQSRAAQLGCWYDVYAFRHGRPEDRQVAVLFSDISEHRRMVAALESSRSRLELLATVAERLLRAVGPYQAVDDVGRLSMAHLNCECFSICVIDRPGRELSVSACAGIPPEVAREIARIDLETADWGAAADGHHIAVPGTVKRRQDARRELLASHGIRAYCCHPLVAQGALLGTLSFGVRSRDAFGVEEVALMKSVTDHVAVAVQRIDAQRALRVLNNSLEQRVLRRTAQVQHQADQLRALASELGRAEQRERRRLATILHDHVQQLLAAARMQVRWVKREAEGERLLATVRGVDAILGEALSACRNLALDLCPPVLHEAGLSAAINWLASCMKERHQLTVVVRAETKADPRSEEIRALLFECVRELLFNVVKHAGTAEAGVTLLQTGDRRVRIIVRDEGKGFDPDRLRRRSAADATFGLFSIQERLAQVGGQMVLETAPGKGTRVTLTAPSAEQPPRPAEEPAGRVSEETVAIRRKSALCRVLIVDDHKMVREGLAGLFQFESDIEVVGHAADGPQAIELARQLQPDVIIMDVSLGAMSGVEATRRILADGSRAKVIGLSMHLDGEVAQAMREAGAIAYLTKDGPTEELIATVRACRPG